MKTLNIIGCGRAARTLARLWSHSGSLQVQDVLTRSAASAVEACAFIGAGQPVDVLAHMRPADFWMLGVPDSAIVAAAERLSGSGALRDGDAVFHLSGFTASTALAAAIRAGARTASAHPVLSFADPACAIAQFAGVLVGVEGEARLRAELHALFAAIGGECFPVDAQSKPLYHAGSVFASNFMVVIVDAARRAYLDAGVPQQVAERLLAPLARNAVDNVLARGPAALTGPAARGDHAVVEAQARVVSAWDADSGKAYDALTALAYRIAGIERR
ncbi:Rossmann-like and DUF2520 domain-containing protein [Rhodocyclaceae bacterium SMB388]